MEPFNAVNKKVTWHSSDTSVATVDTRGLVTVVGPGTAVITVETVEGSYTATCVINGSGGEIEEPIIAEHPANGVVKLKTEHPKEQEAVESTATTDTGIQCPGNSSIWQQGKSAVFLRRGRRTGRKSLPIAIFELFRLSPALVQSRIRSIYSANFLGFFLLVRVKNMEYMKEL